MNRMGSLDPVVTPLSCQQLQVAAGWSNCEGGGGGGLNTQFSFAAVGFSGPFSEVQI